MTLIAFKVFGHNNSVQWTLKIAFNEAWKTFIDYKFPWGVTALQWVNHFEFRFQAKHMYLELFPNFNATKNRKY